jgi:ABC-type Mn2+/Zn2+ transport system permease subunit
MILHSLEWLKIDFMQKALFGSSVLSVVSGLLGLFVVLKRIIFISMSLAEVSSAAVALAFLLGTNPSVTGVVITLIATFVLAIASRKASRFPPEALIAIVYMLASSTAILMIAKNPAGEVDLMNVLFGNILTVNDRQLWESLVVSIPSVAVLLFFFRFFIFTSFDPEMASTSGVSTNFWQSLFYFMLGSVIVVGIRMSGALLTFSYLVIPAYCGLRLSKKMKWVVAWSIFLGPVATFLGLWVSFSKDLPTGPAITAVLVAMAGLSLAVARIKN